MWVRGLKLHNVITFDEVNSVAPYVGAWIETIIAVSSFGMSQVAPYVGAWIETPYFEIFLNLTKSHPMWVRGLKL